MKNIVVIGGGFAGSFLAKRLENKFNVTLIDAKDYFEFTPGVLRVLVKEGYSKKIQVSHSSYLKRAKVVVGEVDEVGDAFVKVNRKKFNFDYLAICSGSRYELPFKEQGVFAAGRAEHLMKSYSALKNAKKVSIIGGGIVGVELAAEIIGEYSDKEIILVHSGSRLIERNSEKAANYVEDYLNKKGVKILCGQRVEKIRKNYCLTSRGRRIEKDLVFLCTGIKPNIGFLKRSWFSEEGVKVNKFLQVHGRENIFAAGDVDAVNEEKTAQNAEWQAKLVLKNILALDSGNPLESYKSRKTPQVISLGKYRGVFEFRRFVLTGWIPALMKWGIRVKEMWKRN